jgi:hypothetical protein
MYIRTLRFASIALVALVIVGVAQAAQRTFVATHGNDVNGCSLAAPCRSFATAIAATDPNGEIVVLDSGGYGPVTIDKSISIVSPPGVYAGISVFAGQYGVEVDTAGIQVVLRGLTINGLGGSYGIVVTATSLVDIERCDVGHMALTGILANVDGASISVKDSSVHDNTGNGITIANDVLFRIERTRVQRSTADGISATDGASGTVSDSTMSANGGSGLLFRNNAIGETMELVVSNSHIEGNAVNGMTLAGLSAGTMRIEASGNVVSGNASYGAIVTAPGATTMLATFRDSTFADNGVHGVNANFGSVTLNLARNVIVGNADRGVAVQNAAVVNTYADNVVRDNAVGQVLGPLNVVGGV